MSHGNADPGCGERIRAAAALLGAADGLLITAGAGMGVDSGLPDFRGRQGFWSAYPALARANIEFESIANPEAFARDPALAWGFYGHRLNLYRATVPHQGFHLLQDMAARMNRGAFVLTSNVDGQFQKAGFAPERVCEVHGSIHHLQCSDGCGAALWPADDFQPVIDEEHCRLVSPLPHCPACGAVARPNILMFGDWHWLDGRSAAQQQRLHAWLARVERPAVIELGAGTQIATIRRWSERYASSLIRVNPRAPEIPGGEGISLAMGAGAAIAAIAAAGAAPR